MKKFLAILLLIISVSLTLTACSKNKDSKNTNSENKTVNTSLGKGEFIPIKNGFGEVIPNKFFIKIPCNQKPTNQEIIKLYKELNSDDLNFNYFLIVFGEYGIHFAKGDPIGLEGKLDNDPNSIQPGSQVSTDKFLKIEGDSLKVEDKKAS